MTQQLTFITSHPMKAKGLSWHLDYPVSHKNLGLQEIQSLDAHEIVIAKAEAAYRHLKQPVLVEDFSLSLDALGGLPGPLIRWFLEALQPEGICKLLDSYPSRDAIAQVCFALRDADGVHIFESTTKGTITTRPRGSAIYGTDNIFIPLGHDKVWTEMSKDESFASSIRRTALKKLETYLHSH